MPASAVDQRLAQQHLTFALAVQRAIAPDPSATGCWSPFSVASALGLTAAGARGDTRAELTHLLAAEQAPLLTQAAELTDEAILNVANTLWTRADVKVRPEFAEDLSAWPGGAIKDAPFNVDPERSRQLINTDVADITRGLIPELLAHGDITAGTVATLVNALYLKVAWRTAFPDAGTEPRPFRDAGDVPTMRLAKQLGYAAAHGWQAVFLPGYGGAEAVALLPDAPLTEAEPGLTAPALADLLGRRTVRQVELYLPRFRVRSRADLTGSLAELGVRTLFSGDADLSGISDEPIVVSKVLHEAVLTIDEQGLEGAAATAVVMRMMAMARRPEQAVVVRVDRPFLFLVRHAASGAVYFLARVVRPG
ncbi:MAG TPA: serpin family protein [Pseudonocardiaceae bacterium]|nr:serpin family protein [Pseudonocardiaceae bacterium]